MTFPSYPSPTRFSFGRCRSLLLTGIIAFLLAACATSNESDSGANQDYADDEATARPTLPMPAGTEPEPAVEAAKSKPKVAARPKPRPRPVARKPVQPSPRTIERLAAAPRRETQYTKMVDRTSTGVRSTQDFSSQARTKQQRDNAAAVKAYRAEKNTRMARAYNNNNLLTR
jgi:type IV secretory pathway VirB10-like protein